MNTIDDIINFVNGWLESKGLPQGTSLTDAHITEFIGELQEQISHMDFSVPEGATIIVYTGNYNGINAWEVAEQISEAMGDGAVCITDLPAGKLINDDVFQDALYRLLNNDGGLVDKIVTGYENGVRLEGGSCGYSVYLSLNDFASSKFTGESTRVSENLIIFAPGELEPSKVFATTELERIFANDSFKYINGIPKEELLTIYSS